MPDPAKPDPHKPDPAKPDPPKPDSPKPDPAPAPLVSIIVPVYRQWRLLPGLIAALQSQDLDRQAFEVIVVNNEPGAHARAQTLVADAGPRFRTLTCVQPGSYAARNAGVASSRGALLLFTDADCLPARDWARQMLDATRTRPGGLVAGRVDITLPANPNRWQVFDHIRGIPQDLFVAHGYGATANLAVPRAVFEALGGFDTTLLSGGDANFCRRAGRAGHRVHYAAQGLVFHPARSSLTALRVKARRVKGGQVASGPFWRRMLWTLRSLVPPLREMLHYAKTAAPWSQRRTAMSVRLMLWRVELAEIARLLLLRTPRERR